MEKTVETRLIAVIGAGAMGSGIAQVAATSGFRVNLSDVSAAVLEKALASIRKSLWRCRGAMGIAGGLWRVETRVTSPSERRFRFE
jgi:3-hydroxybutyryl-CoA dehydrogenase